MPLILAIVLLFRNIADWQCISVQSKVKIIESSFESSYELLETRLDDIFRKANKLGAW